MVGIKGKSGGARPGAGRKPGSRNRRRTGRRTGAHDASLSPARIVPMAEKWNFAEAAFAHAQDMIEILVSIAKDETQPGSVRVMAADKVMDRAVGRAQQFVDITAKRHTDIVYQPIAPTTLQDRIPSGQFFTDSKPTK